MEDAGGRLGGWVGGDGVPVLLLHGGLGLSFEYLDELVLSRFLVPLLASGSERQGARQRPHGDERALSCRWRRELS